MTVRLAYMHRTFPGIFGSLVGFMAAREFASSVFIAERWARDVHFPGVRKARMPGPDPEQAQKNARQHCAESKMVEMSRSAARAGDTMLRLRKGGFLPDVLYATADEGYLLYAKDIFPKARLVVRLGSLYSREMLLGADGAGPVGWQNSTQTTMGRMQNCFTLSALNACDLGIVTSEWQMQMFAGACAKDKICMVPSGVDTRVFSPAVAPLQEEVVTFACQGVNPARGIHAICECLPLLLAQRPKCRARLLSFAPSRSEGARQQHEEVLRNLLPFMSEEQLGRVELVISPSQEAYVNVLRQSTAYVYLTTPTMLSAGLLEAMSCGAMVIASDTGPVRELVQHEENGFLCDAKVGATLAETVAQVLGQAQDLKHVGRNARETVLAKHDLRKLLPVHAAHVFGIESNKLV